jgi:hypothetical protein
MTEQHTQTAVDKIPIGGNPIGTLSRSTFSRTVSNVNKSRNKSGINISIVQPSTKLYKKNASIHFHRMLNREKNEYIPVNEYYDSDMYSSSMTTISQPNGPPNNKPPRTGNKTFYCNLDDAYINDEIDIVKLCNDFIDERKNTFLHKLIKFITNVMKMVLKEFSKEPTFLSNQSAFMLSILMDTCLEIMIAIFNEEEHAHIIHFFKSIMKTKHNNKHVSIKVIITSQVILKLLSNEQNIKSLDRLVISNINQTSKKQIAYFKKHHLENLKTFINENTKIQRAIKSLNNNLVNNYRKK